ncbi:DUF726-domain-containing protein [Polyplosphaeria fusca]|uniref:DUF726-domain-containing protein n=1 Tax=Polyplosphaeria fusca TaxID=682080 RepID=A0A9P4UXL3_9PLEO|nr:DUF726-domain-containing protein [Polyplosphaeria fusca]
MLYKVANYVTGAGPDAAQQQDEGTSLTSVLETPALRVELALLILLCTDAMRSDLLATFDPDKTHDTSATAPPPSPKPKASPVHDLISFDTPEDEIALAKERARVARKEEVESTQMLGLRRAALTFFDKWRAGAMHRVCDVLCLRGEVVRRAKLERKKRLDEDQRSRQGNSLLIDFEGDPFGTPSNNEQKKHGHYDVIENKLEALGEPKRVLVLHCILLLLLSLEHYPAHSRVLLLRLAGSLQIESDVLAEHEKSVAQGLLASAASQMDAEETAKRQAANDSASRKWKVGLATIGGVVLIGVTGGLAAPLLAAGVGTVMGGLGLGATAISGLLGGLAGSSVLVGSLFGAYGGKMTGRLMKQYAKEVQDFEFIPVQDPNRPAAQSSEDWSEDQDAKDPKKREQHRLRVTIGVSGWLNSPSDVNKPWEIIDASGTEPFALRFEMDAMLRLGNSLNEVLFNYAWDGVTYTVVSRTLLGALYAGLWPLGLVKVASVLDNPFSIALARADKAGKVLAHALMDKVQGERPVTLVGYSIGARVIYACLVELADQNAFGLVESVALMGAPVPSDSLSWRKARSVVSSRVVNVFSAEDYILGFLYRSTKLQMGVAGLHQIKDVFGIENVDMSKLVTGHDRYRYLIGSILTKIGFGDIDFNSVAEQTRALEQMERKKKQVKEQVKKQKQDTRQPEPLSRTTSEPISCRNEKPNELIDTTPTPTSAQSSQAMRRAFMTQRTGTGQQPQRSSRPTPSTIQPAQPSHAFSEMDPLSGTIPTEPRTTSSPAAFPAPYLTNRQIPSNMHPTPSPQQKAARETIRPEADDSSDDDKIVMQDLDEEKSSPARGMSGIAKPGRDAGKGVAITAVQMHNDSDSDEDVSSEFGELRMVEPTPIEEDEEWEAHWGKM